MERQKKVVDASVVMKWFVKEEDTDKALSLKEGHVHGDFSLIAPDFLFIEVLNGLRYKKHPEQALIQANNGLWNIEIETQPLSENVLTKAIEIALKHSLTIYDSLYAAVAQFHGVPLITADKELYKLPNVIPLEKT